MVPGHVVVVGASLAGLRTVEGLRRGGFEGTITVVGDEAHLPYTRPPLSKQVLAGDWEPERAALRRPEAIEALDVDLRLGTRALSLDTADRVVHVTDGAVAYDALVIATGAAARRLPGDDRPGVHVLRTLDDAVAIRDAMAAGPRVVVVGAGFIGAEVAAVARGRGLPVTMVEPLAAPMLRGLGPGLAEVAAAIHRDHGVDLRCGVGVAGFEGDERVTGVRLTDGRTVPADLVVVGVGVVPNTGWLEGSGLTLADGVLCDPMLAAVGVEDVWAVGDVARWQHPGRDEPVRLEHWTVAAEHGRAAAANILAGRAAATPHAPVPYVWSDQYDTKIQIVGWPGDEFDVVHGSLRDRRFVAVLGQDGAVSGAVGFGSPRALAMLQVRLEQGPLSSAEAREVVAA